MMENRDNCPNCWWWWTISGCIKLNKQSRRNLWEGLYKKYIQNLNAGVGGTAAVHTPLCWIDMNYKNISAFWRKGHFSSTLVSAWLGMVSALKTITFWSREVAAFSQKNIPLETLSAPSVTEGRKNTTSSKYWTVLEMLRGFSIHLPQGFGLRSDSVSWQTREYFRGKNKRPALLEYTSSTMKSKNLFCRK